VANAPTEFSLLLRDRDHAAYGVVGAATVALSFLNMKEVPLAVKTLLRALDLYHEADGRISEFHKSQTQKKENQHVSASTTDRESNAA
jgi:hypothetical protein